MDKNKYQNIIRPINQYMDNFNEYLKNHFNIKLTTPDKCEIVPIINDYFSNTGKQIRPAIIFLLIKALGREIIQKDYKLALIQELIHNATLIHDDIIDCSVLRHNKCTLNFEYDSKLAVLAGDYLLSEAMLLANTVENAEIQRIHLTTIDEMVRGELQQYFNRFKLLSIDDYIKKSKAKTAKLFECGVVSAYLQSEGRHDNINSVRDFAINFGIAFQIRNDINSFAGENSVNEDLTNGDYSAPIIYLAEETGLNDLSDSNPKLLLKHLKTSKAFEKTELLISDYLNKAIENIAFIEDNQYKQCLIDLCEYLKTTDRKYL